MSLFFPETIATCPSSGGIKATTHEVVQEDRSVIMPKFLFPHLQCQTRERNSREKALSSVEVILKEGVVPQVRGFAVCNCRVS